MKGKTQIEDFMWLKIKESIKGTNQIFYRDNPVPIDLKMKIHKELFDKIWTKIQYMLWNGDNL